MLRRTRKKLGSVLGATVPPRVRQAVARLLMDPPGVRHAEPTLLLCMDDEPIRPSQRLYDLAAQLAAETPKAMHPILSTRQGGTPPWYNVFPGEHYHLLTTICRVLAPKTVWEFGTDSGLGTVAILEGLPPGGHIFTVDIDPISSRNRPWLTDQDLASGRVTQIISDMKAPQLFCKYQQELAEAELLFVDGPKDNFTEHAFLEQLARVPFRRSPIVMFDDIRVMNMLRTWRGITRPKMNLTSFGHWSGTGLIDWSASATGAS